MLQEFKKPKCERCGSTNVRARINGDIVCIKCGHVTKKKEGLYIVKLAVGKSSFLLF